MDDDFLEFRHADLIKFGELVVSLELDYEEEYLPTLHKLVKNWSRSSNEPQDMAKLVNIEA